MDAMQRPMVTLTSGASASQKNCDFVVEHLRDLRNSGTYNGFLSFKYLVNNSSTPDNIRKRNIKKIKQHQLCDQAGNISPWIQEIAFTMFKYMPQAKKAGLSSLIIRRLNEALYHPVTGNPI